ncbi:MAG: glycosyltransferase [Bdellovibrionota bacterium]
MTSPRITVIATTYNQSRDLDLYLRSLAAQQGAPQDFEVVIADDGSKQDTRAVLNGWRERHFGGRLKHVWHDDEGYRKSKILNSAIRESQGDYLIFTDSDLIVHPRFVADHHAVAGVNSFFMGRRVDLGESASEWVRAHPEKLFSASFYLQVIASAFGPGASRNVKRALRIAPPALARAMGCMRVPDLLGSNFSMDRELLYRVNGFDESSEHYWGEDGDLFVRVRNSGARIFGRKSYAVQLHLWHPQRKPAEGAERAYEKKLADSSYRTCRAGIKAI